MNNTLIQLSLFGNKNMIPKRANGREWIYAPVPDTKIKGSCFFSRKIGSHGPFVNKHAVVDAVGNGLVYDRREIWL